VAVKAKTKTTSNHTVRIKLRSFDHALLDQSSGKIVHTAQRSGAKVLGPIPLPTDIKRWTVLKSPHVNKNSGEHFDLRVHKRLIDIIDPPATTIDALTKLDLPAGVDIEIKS
jgi:small subunit ribosomal protein S10